MARVHGQALALAVVVLAGCKPLVRSSDGHIATPTPPGSGWTHEEPLHLSYEPTVTEISWMHSDGRLSAREMVVEPTSIEALCGPDWKAYYEQRANVTSVNAQPFVRAGVPACRVSSNLLLDGFSRQGTQLREVFLPHGDRLLLLTAMGDHVVDEPAMADEWMAGVKFRALGDAF